VETKLLHILPEQYVVSEWSGGKTVQLAIAPEGSVYGDRDFLWRLSSATVELDESDFTPLPDYTRLISVLRGEMRLSHNGGNEISLSPYAIHSFDGAVPTHSWGRCVDFNLMLRKDRCRGSLQALRFRQPGEMTMTQAVPSPKDYPNCTLALYCGAGGLRLSVDGQNTALKAGETVLIQAAGSVDMELAWTAGTDVMLAQIHC
jgi:environmental stress-induced protein Ves